MASRKQGWGYDRIAGALANLEHEISDRRLAMSCDATACRRRPERKRTTTWVAFVRTHLALPAGANFLLQRC